MSEDMGFYEKSGSIFEDFRRAGAEGEAAIVRFVYDYFDEARVAKWKIAGFQHDMWDRLDDLCNPYGLDGGGSFQGYDRFVKRKKSRENYIFQLIEAQKPLMMEQGITCEVAPQNQDDAPIAIMLQDILDYSMERDELSGKKFRKYIDFMLRRGTGVGKVGWNPYAESYFNPDGSKTIYGNTETHILDPKMVYCDPFATSFNDAAYVICAYFVDKEVLKERFGEKAEQILTVDTPFTQGRRGPFPPKDRPAYWDRFTTGSKEDERKKRGAFVVELWIRQPKVTQTRMLEMTDDARAQEELALEAIPGPMVVTVAGGVLLNYAPSPYHHGRFPFFSAQNYDVHDSIWGRSTPEVLAGLQAELDWINDHIRAYVKLVSTPFLVVPKDSQINYGTFSNRLLPLLRPNIGANSQFIRFVTPPPIPSQLLQRKADIINAMRKIEGIDEINVDVIRTRQQAASSIALVKEASESRLRGKMSNVNSSFRDWAYMTISNIQQFWTEDRIVRLTGRKDRNGNIIPLQINPQMLSEFDVTRFDINVEIAPGRSLSRAVRYQQLIELDSRGILGPPDFTNYDRRKLIAETTGVPGVLDMIVEEEEEARKTGEQMAQMELQAAAHQALEPQPVSQEAMQKAGNVMAGEPQEGVPI